LNASRRILGARAAIYRKLPEMANPDHLQTLRHQGVHAWNAWREREPSITPDLSDADLSGWYLIGATLVRAHLVRADLSEANLRGAHLREANLSGANLSGANLFRADLSKADLSEANLSEANLNGASLFGANLLGTHLFRAHLSGADLSGAHLFRADISEANLSGASLFRAHLSEANLSGANLSGAHLSEASLVDADITNANLTGCRIYGVSAWGLKLSDETKQQNLIISRSWDDSEITVDNIEVAQFIYLMLNNQKIRSVIDTITSKVVLILGRFTAERKAVLDALRDELRKRDYLPILFDFDKPTSRTTVETITLLGRMARFVIADISDAKSVLQELQAIVPDLPSVPVQSVIITSQDEPGMFDSFRSYRSFLPVHNYDTPAQLLRELRARVIEPSEAKALELRATTAATSLNLWRDSRDRSSTSHAPRWRGKQTTAD
jgi:uncharacterized protein YjbI with pentapeptide repeats